MEKEHLLEMDLDPATFICVNPYEVNPILESTILHSPTLTVDVPLKGEPHIVSQTWDTFLGGGFYGPNKKVKLEMEEFSDLSSFVLPKPKLTNSVDELNTPVFDKDAFDFTINVIDKDSQSEDPPVKLERDAYYKNTCITTNNQCKNFSLNTAKVHQKENINSEVANNIILAASDINVLSLKSEGESTYINCEISPSYENTNTPICNVDDNSALSVNSNDRHYSFISSPEEMFTQFQSGLETPEDSNSSSVFLEPKSKTLKLSLNTNMRVSATDFNLNTPAILEEVVNLESANFNILDLVADEEISYVNEEIFSPPSTVSLPTVEETTSAILQMNDIVPEKRTRKRRNSDDEDYLPPSKKSSQQRRRAVDEESDSDSDSEFEVKPKRKGRGRPPKRTESISSDCSKEGDVSKYRELRDRNNEASRKSRLKRKTKEQELELEAESLLRVNIKLKAQVEELEKMVTNFRDNLFKIMIKK